jgi:hypothetical protein
MSLRLWFDSTSVFGMRPAFSRIAIGMVTWPLEVMRMG